MSNSRNQLWIMTGSGSTWAMDLDLVMSTNHEFIATSTEHSVERGSAITDHIQVVPDKVTFEVFISNQPLEDPRMSLTKVPLTSTLVSSLTGQDSKIPGPIYPPGVPITPPASGGVVTFPIDKALKKALGAPEQQFDLMQTMSPGGALTSITGAIKGLFSGQVTATICARNTDRMDTPVAHVQILAGDLASASTGGEGFDNVADALKKLREIQSGEDLVELFTPHVSYTSMHLESITMARSRGDGDGATLSLTFKKIRIVDTQTTTAPKMAATPKAAAEVKKGVQPPAEVPPTPTNKTVFKTIVDFAVTALGK